MNFYRDLSSPSPYTQKHSAHVGREWGRLATRVLLSAKTTLRKRKHMGVFKALGMGIAIVILKLLMPDVMSGFEGTLASFFGVTQTVLVHMQASLSR